MEKTVRDLDLGWVRHTDGNGGYVWNCYHPETKELLGVYKDEELIDEATLIEYEIIEKKRIAKKYQGVSFSSAPFLKGREAHWESRLHHDKKRHYIGLFESPEEAHEAYKNKAVELGLQEKIT